MALLLSGLFVFGMLISGRILLPYSCRVIGTPDLLGFSNVTTFLLEYGAEIETENGKRGVCSFELRCRDKEPTLDCKNREPIPRSINCWVDPSGNASCKLPVSSAVSIIVVGSIFVVSGLILRYVYWKQTTLQTLPISQLTE